MAQDPAVTDDVIEFEIEGEEEAVVTDEPVNDNANENATSKDDLDSDEHDGDEHDGGEGADASADLTEEEREAIRERRRAERREKKEQQRKREDSLRREVATLRRDRETLSERLALLERRTTGSELAQIDSALGQAERATAFFKDQIRIATEANDGAALAEATSEFYKAQQKVENMQRLKQAVVQNNQRQQSPAPQQAEIDPDLKRHANNWMRSNSWYDPQGRDQDSRVMLAIDSQLADEGYDPRSEEFWQELTARASRFLPHRFTQQRQQERRPPRQTVAGSGRESGAGQKRGNVFKVSPERVAAMKEAGIWDDPKKRNEMLKEYQAYDKANKQ